VWTLADARAGACAGASASACACVCACERAGAYADADYSPVPQFYALDGEGPTFPLEGVAGADDVAVPCCPHQGYQDGPFFAPPWGAMEKWLCMGLQVLCKSEMKVTHLFLLTLQVLPAPPAHE
jgi:hypothetical protein